MNPMITSDLDLPVAEVDSDLEEKQPDDVANITPDDSTDDLPESQPPEPQEAEPLANDYDAVKEKWFKELDDLETVAEATYTWHIEDWKRLPKKVHSDRFDCGGMPWRVLSFPFGNSQNDFCSFYLEQGHEEKPPEDWYACVQFLLVLWNPSDPSIQQRHSATHRYNADESDWGFTRFFELRRLMRYTADGRGILDDGAANLTAFVRIIKDPTGVLWHSFNNYDSKKETGMVGLKNQGATCYLNSLLQSLYFTNAFRKAIYQIPTENETDFRNNSAYALQRLWYLLQTSDSAVSTSELTTSFGWESRQIFEQQDVQELSRILMDKMEERMKGTPAEKALPKLFVGKMKTYIDCINVDYESSRHEDFWDIQLNVRGNATLDDSFKDYIQVETMEGDNKYFAEGHGLQDARKGVIFESFPEVLHLQLKRFEYNFQADAMTKVYDRCEFPEVWDASPYLSESADRSEPYIYHLHGVLVHSGDLNAGHYYAFLKPHKEGPFYKFDDDRVTKATIKEALDENYGGDFTNQSNGLAGQRNPYTRTWSKQRFMSAYMLVYIRQSRLDHVLEEVHENEIPPHLDRNIKAEQEEIERKRKEREEAHLYMQVVAGTNQHFSHHQGFDIFPSVNLGLPLVHPSMPKAYRLLKTTPLENLRAMISEEFGIEKDLLRPWGLVGRQNATLRPDSPLVWDEMSIEEAAQKLQLRVPLRLWMENASRLPDGNPDFIDYDTVMDAKSPSQPILLFLKHFDAEQQTLRGVGHIYMAKNQKVSDIGPRITERMGWPEGTALKLYEEIKVKMIDPMKTNSTFASSELQHGDIVCFQKVLPDAEWEALQQAGKFIDPPSFYNYLAHRVEVVFSDRNDPEPESTKFKLELSRIMTYDQVALKVGQHLGVDPSHLRFSTVHSQTGRPRQYVKRGPTQTLSSIFAPSYSTYGSVINQRSDWLMYELLDMPLAELETKKLVKISLLTEGISKEELFDILVPKTGNMSDVVAALTAKAQLSEETVNDLRFYEAHSGRIYRELLLDTSVSSLNEWVAVYADTAPAEEVEPQAADLEHAVNCFHFDREVGKTWGVPFRFVLWKDETFKDMKERLSQRTGIKGKQWEKIKVAVVPRTGFQRPEYLQDDDVVIDKMVSADDSIGLDHVNKNRPPASKADVMMIR